MGDQVAGGSDFICGVMLESHLVAGRQDQVAAGRRRQTRASPMLVSAGKKPKRFWINWRWLCASAVGVRWPLGFISSGFSPVPMEGLCRGVGRGLVKPGPALPPAAPPRGAREAQPGTVPAPLPHKAAAHPPTKTLHRLSSYTGFNNK